MRSKKTLEVSQKQCAAFIAAVRNSKRIDGLTHGFYRYPARFSPQFAAAAIRCFTKPGDVVLDPYMGGGTTIVEALASGRRAIGNDLNALAVFVARVKTCMLNHTDIDALRSWGLCIPPKINFRHFVRPNVIPSDERIIRNLGLYRSRYLKKGIALALGTIEELPTKKCRDFARCAILHVAQLALDGKRTRTSLIEFRSMLSLRTENMLNESMNFSQATLDLAQFDSPCHLYEGDAQKLPLRPVFSEQGQKADVVITSPPYPGVHILYHRWQVDGRKETAAPYWIAACQDGEGAAYYNFGERKQSGLRTYFDTATKTFRAVRTVMKEGACLIQLVAFSDPDTQLPQYLDTLEQANLEEVFLDHQTGERHEKRIWRDVPNRKWHAISKGVTSGAREVVLIHRAV